MRCKAIRERFLKKNDKSNPIYCIVASASYKSTYMYSDWLNNFWIAQSHLLPSPHSTISVNNKPIQKDDVPICLYAYNTGARRTGEEWGSALSTAGTFVHLFTEQ